MKLFHWQSDTLSRVGWGHIIVMAMTIEQARQIASVKFLEWINEPDSPFSYLTYGVPDEDEEEEIKILLEKFKADITKEPIDNKIALFIQGSE